MKLKQLWLLLICGSFSFQLFGQDECQWFASEVLDVNNVSAKIRIGDLWWDSFDGEYYVPNDGSNITSIFAGGFWLGGIDPGGGLHVSASTYGGTNFPAYWAGPLDPTTGLISEPDCDYWNRLFPIEFSEVVDHIADYNDNSTIDGPVPAHILGWPGRGNPEFFGIHEYELPDQDLAPFWDRDGDGNYEPMGGDYPLMKGQKAFWWVFNDLGYQDNIGGNAAQFEIQAMAFAYASSDSYIDNTTYYDFKLISRGIETLDSTYVGLWIDPDLGCFEDDYLGCSPEANMAYVYNADDFDQDCIVPGYGEDIPVLGVKVLRGLEDETGAGPGFSNFMYYDNTAFPGVPPGMGDPQIGTHVYHLLNSRWIDGLPLTQSGTGYNIGSPLPPYPYAFDGSDVNGTPWTMCDLELPPSDTRMVISSGPVKVEPGDVRYLSYAVIWQQGLEYPCPDLTDFIDGGETVEDFYDNIDQTPTSVSSIYLEQELAEFFPNPVNDELQVQLVDPTVKLERLEFFSSNGQQIKLVEGHNRERMVLSTGDWPSGVYFYRLWTTKGQLQTGKLIVQ